MRKILSLLIATLFSAGLFANSYWYRGGDNSWGATAMTVSTDGMYEYIQSSNATNQFKIAASADGWDYNYTYVQAGFNSTDVTSIGDYSKDNCYCWQSGTYYILVYYPSTKINATDKPIICASTTLPDASASDEGDGVTLTFTYYDSDSGDGSKKLSTVEDIFAEASQAYVKEVNTGTQVYAGRKYKEGDDYILSNLKFGSSSAVGELKFTLKDEVEVDSIIFRAAMYAKDEGGEGFKVNDDNFTLSAGKLAFEDKVWKPTGKVSSIDIVQNKASKGRFFLTSITIYPKSAGGDPEPPTPAEKDSIYFVNVKGWDNPRVHLWGGTAGETKWPGVEMTKVSAEADGGAPAAARGVKLIKMDETAKINGYDVYKYVADKGAYAHCIFSNNGADQTADLDWTSDSYFYDGAWYADEEEIPAPAAPKYHIAGGWTDWKLVELAVATDEQTATYKAELAKGDYEFKIVRTVGTDTTWLTKANAGQAYGLHREWVGVADVKDQADENLKVTADEGGKYVFTWTFANDSIGITFPAKRAFNETWGVGAETAVAAGTKYVDNFAVTIETVYATTLKTNARKFDAYAFTHAIQVRNAAYPSAETPAGTEQSGSTSLVITAKEDVDLTFFYNRQTTSESTGDAESNDNKDMKVFDQAAPTTALEAEFRVVWMQEDKKYVNAVKTISLVKGHTYTVSAKGTTIQLSGIRYATDAEAPVANYFIVGNAEVFGGWSTFIPVYEETFEVENLAAGDYAFRLCMNDGEWTDDYGFAQLTVKPEGVSTDDHNNICFKLKEASNLKVTYKPAAGDDAAVFTVEANFYVPAKKDLYLVPNQWAEADAKIAAWVWNKEYTINAFTEFFAPKAEGNDTLVAKVFAEADSIIFVRFNKDAAEPKWNGGEGYLWNQTPDDSIQWDKAVFTIVPGGDYYSNGTWDPYVAPVPVLADGFYLIGQKGWDVAALSADLLFAANPDNEGEYQLTVTLVKDEGIKVVRVESDVIKQWYPDGEGNEYKVDDAHAGQKTIYFKPDYVADWAAFGGYIYIEANQPTGLDKLAVDAKAVKAIIGGQLFIIRNGKTYTAQGVMVR